MTDDRKIVIIGAGPAGLTAAYVLCKRGAQSTVLESDNVVGGISRTATADGWRFDIGGHRFFTKVQPVEDLWFEILGPDDFLRRPRLEPHLLPGQVLRLPDLGDERAEEPRADRSVALRRLVPLGARPPAEGHVDARGLRRVAFRLAAVPALLQDPEREGLGCPVHRDPGRLGSAAHQEPVAVPRSVGGAQAQAHPRQAAKSKQVTSLIEEFNYPKYGPGMMWERCAELVTAQGTKIMFDATVTKVEHHAGKAPSR